MGFFDFFFSFEKDIIDLSTGEDIHKFVDLFQSVRALSLDKLLRIDFFYTAEFPRQELVHSLLLANN